MPPLFRISPWKVWLDGHEPWLRGGHGRGRETRIGYNFGYYSDLKRSCYYDTSGFHYEEVVMSGQKARVVKEKLDNVKNKVGKEHCSSNGNDSGHETADSDRIMSLSTMLEENVLNDEDIILLKADATAAIDKLIVQHKIVKKPNPRQFSQNCILLSLPLEMFLSVVVHLDVRDVESLGMTCRDLNNMMRTIFVPRVVLPLSEQNMEIIDGRFVLSLSSNVIIKLWGVNNEFEKILEKMNLTHVKEVKFIGNNYKVHGGGLSSTYKRALGNMFLGQKYVRKLEISIDSSEECYNQLQRLKEMPFLEELCLRSSGGFSMVPCDRTLNEVLKDTLQELKIHTFELNGIAKSWDMSKDFELKIYSETIQTLKIQNSKNMELTEIVANNLKEIQIISDYYCTFCLLHAHSDRLAGVLARGCPNLEKYNGIDLLPRNGSLLEVLDSQVRGGLNRDDNMCQYSCLRV